MKRTMGYGISTVKEQLWIVQFSQLRLICDDVTSSRLLRTSSVRLGYRSHSKQSTTPTNPTFRSKLDLYVARCSMLLQLHCRCGCQVSGQTELAGFHRYEPWRIADTETWSYGGGSDVVEAIVATDRYIGKH